MSAKDEDQDQGQKTRLLELVGKFDTAMLVTRTTEGRMRGRPLSLAKEHDAGMLYFSTSIESPKVGEIEGSSEVLVTLQDRARYVSISGTARMTRDRALIERLWSEAWKVWFPAGKDDPALCIVAVTPHDAEYWDQSGAKGLKYAIEMVKAYATGTTPESGGSALNAKVHM